MKVRRTERFKKDYQQLPRDVRERIHKQLKLLVNNPRHPSLRTHKVRGVEGLWEFSVTMNYRVLFQIEGGYYVLLAVGGHGMVDRI